MESAFWLQGRAYYQSNLAMNAVMYFPRQIDLMDRRSIINAIDDRSRWIEVTLEGRQRIDLNEDTVALTYPAQVHLFGSGNVRHFERDLVDEMDIRCTNLETIQADPAGAARSLSE
ncbi:MAG: hypothetical protein WBR18_13480 [Anaerolineales bacterium]